MPCSSTTRPADAADPAEATRFLTCVPALVRFRSVNAVQPECRVTSTPLQGYAHVSCHHEAGVPSRRKVIPRSAAWTALACRNRNLLRRHSARGGIPRNEVGVVARDPVSLWMLPGPVRFVQHRTGVTQRNANSTTTTATRVAHGVFAAIGLESIAHPSAAQLDHATGTAIARGTLALETGTSTTVAIPPPWGPTRGNLPRARHVRHPPAILR
jgi:hypothetical protein